MVRTTTHELLEVPAAGGSVQVLIQVLIVRPVALRSHDRAMSRGADILARV